MTAEPAKTAKPRTPFPFHDEQQHERRLRDRLAKQRLAPADRARNSRDLAEHPQLHHRTRDLAARRPRPLARLAPAPTGRGTDPRSSFVLLGCVDDGSAQRSLGGQYSYNLNTCFTYLLSCSNLYLPVYLNLLNAAVLVVYGIVASVAKIILKKTL